MFHEYRDIVSKLKVENAHFEKVFEKHNELDAKIDKDGAHLEQFELEKLKKEKLHLKDEAYKMIVDYKKEHNL
jgi:uncharacterized protein YdcH (DUF465 family)